MKGTYLFHIAFWCTYILIKYASLISGSMITYLFFISILHALCATGMLPECIGRLRAKTSYHWLKDKNLRFNMCIYTSKYHKHHIYSPGKKQFCLLVVLPSTSCCRQRHPIPIKAPNRKVTHLP
jgi:hypothetical protein